jgi:hypothetical protein
MRIVLWSGWGALALGEKESLDISAQNHGNATTEAILHPASHTGNCANFRINCLGNMIRVSIPFAILKPWSSERRS